MSFLIVSDDIPELIQICHRVGVIKNGMLEKFFEENQLDEISIYKELA
jgi:simple sugar transport system ATP-binding protein